MWMCIELNFVLAVHLPEPGIRYSPNIFPEDSINGRRAAA
jgi:hypothetical protein